ncbi:hypothetical protein [Thioclava sp. NG1]|uniref:hypothetical protein n=1 Tax=Thioclava sp. NG1 TaxID=2182426 RepID=UPI0011B1FB51|nr:hypothetical protein [Thioclava sp. NG1]
MTPEEHSMIRELRSEMSELRDEVSALNRALLLPEPDGTPPFLQRAARVVNAAESGSWGIKWSVRIFLALGAILATVSTIKGSIWK